jgi:hypothetical protein
MKPLERALDLPQRLYKALTAWVIPPDADYEERWRASTGVGILMTCIALLTPVSLFNLVISPRVAGLSMGLVLVLLLGTLIHKWTGQVRWGVYTIATIVWLGTAWMAVHKGGLLSAPLNWVPLASLGIVLMLGRSHGSLFWTLMMSAQPILFVLLVDPEAWPEAVGPPWSYALMRAGVCWCAYWLASVLETRRWRAYQTLYQSERSLRATHREMSLLLDHAAQGFVTLDKRGALCGGHTAALERWFGPLPVGLPFARMLARVDRETAQRWRKLWRTQPRSPSSLPRSLHTQSLQLELRYQPLAGAGDCPGDPCLLVILTDITQDQLQHQAETQRRELIALYTQAIERPEEAGQFWEQGQALVRQLQSNPEAEQQEALLRHLEALAQRHSADALVVACQRALETGHTRHATRAFRRAEAAAAPWLEQQRSKAVSIAAADLRELRLLLQTQADHREVQGFFLEKIRRRDQRRSPHAGRTG